MNNLNNIPNAGNWGDAASKLNDNFNKIKQAVTTVENVSKNNKGYFTSLSALNTSFPSPKAGLTAYVYDGASSTNYYIYNAVNGAWVASTVEAPSIEVDLTEYTKTGGSTKTTKDIDDAKANHGYTSLGTAKTLKQVDDKSAQLESDVEQLAYVKINNEAVNGNFENGLTAPFSKTDGGGGASTFAINSSTPISGNYDARLTITTPSAAARPYIRGLDGAANIGDKIYLHFYAKILSGTPSIGGAHNGVDYSGLYRGDVINGRNTIIIDVASASAGSGIFYFSSPSVWDMQIDNLMRINLTETFGAGNEPTEEEMSLLISTLGIDYFEGEITIPAQKIMRWQLELANTAAKKEETLDKLIKGWVLSEAMAISNPTYSADGNISGAVITWGDGDVGSMSNVVVGQYGITSIRYNRSNGDYATMNVVYDSKGEFQSQEVTLIKI